MYSSNSLISVLPLFAMYTIVLPVTKYIYTRIDMYILSTYKEKPLYFLVQYDCQCLLHNAHKKAILYKNVKVWLVFKNSTRVNKIATIYTQGCFIRGFSYCTTV